MKTAIFIRDGKQQVVLTPETDFEKQSLDLFPKDQPNHMGGERKEQPKGNVKFYRGEFYDCQGGFLREGKGKDDLILVIDETK